MQWRFMMTIHDCPTPHQNPAERSNKQKKIDSINEFQHRSRKRVRNDFNFYLCARLPALVLGDNPVSCDADIGFILLDLGLVKGPRESQCTPTILNTISMFHLLSSAGYPN